MSASSGTAERILCALDTPDLTAAEDLAGSLKDVIGGLKLGLEFFGAQGPEGIARISQAGMPVFLDLKFHDIPNTVAGAVRSVTALAPLLLTIHTSGGSSMMRAAVKAAAEAAAAHDVPRPKIIGVSVLTSLDQDDLASLGVSGTVEDQVVRLARLAKETGLDGLVCSPFEIEAVRAACGPELVLVVPGVRPEGAEKGDQKRVMTPKQALDLGADYLVIGRPITEADDPAAAAQAIADSL